MRDGGGGGPDGQRPAAPNLAVGLTYAIVSSIARREAEMVAEMAREVGLLEQRVMAGRMRIRRSFSASSSRLDMSF
jgi:hypothetical protein